MNVANIKRLCAEKKISINELEKAVGLGENTIYKWGKNDPSIVNAVKVAEHLGCSVYDLMKEV